MQLMKNDGETVTSLVADEKVKIYRLTLRKEEHYEQSEGSMLLVISGTVEVNGRTLRAKERYEGNDFTLRAVSDALLLIAQTKKERMEHFYNDDEQYKTIQLHFVTARLMTNDDSFEWIENKLPKRQFWGLWPDETFRVPEGMIVAAGRIRCYYEHDVHELTCGDSCVVAYPHTPLRLEAVDGEATLIYFSTQSTFQSYEQFTAKYDEMALQIEEKDGYTANHCRRIGYLSHEVGKRLGLSAYELAILYRGAFLHDIGKINVPLEVLNKTTALTDEEFALIRRHPEDGAKLLVESDLISIREAACLVAQHHERFDGKGYPSGLAGEDITIGARIIAVVDSFDAMTTNRSYSKARSVEGAVAELRRCSGTMYERRVVDTFCTIIAEGWHESIE